MDGFKAYKYFMSIKLHFTTEKYDVFDANGRVSGSRATFEKRNDRQLFEKLATRFSTDQEYIQFLVANFAYGNRNVVYSSESDEYYFLWKRRKESRTRQFEMDLEKIATHIEKNKLPIDRLYSVDTGMPELLNLYLGGYVCIETMVILQELTDYLSEWEPLIMLWHDSFLTIRKCTRFVKFDKIKLNQVHTNFKHRLSEI